MVDHINTGGPGVDRLAGAVGDRHDHLVASSKAGHIVGDAGGDVGEDLRPGIIHGGLVAGRGGRGGRLGLDVELPVSLQRGGTGDGDLRTGGSTGAAGEGGSTDRAGGLDLHDGDAVQVLGPQLHAHDGVGFANGMAVLALGVEADQVGLAIDGEHQASLGEVAVRRVDVVQVDVLHGQRHDHVAGDLVLGHQEQGGVAQEVLDIAEAELRLDRDTGGAQVGVGVQDVGEAHDIGHGLVHLLELIQHQTLGHGKRHLPGGLDVGQQAGLQEGVEVAQNDVLQLGPELIVDLLDGHVRAVLGNGLDGHAGRVLLHLDVTKGDRRYGGLGVGDLVTLRNGPALQGHGGLVGHELGAGGFTDRTHDAEDGTKGVPVLREHSDEVLLTRIDGDIRHLSGSVFDGHVKSLSDSFFYLFF